MSIAKRLGNAGTEIDERFHAATFARRNLKKVFPDHWSFMLGEIALYSFVILLLTGVFLTLFFKPSMTEAVYQGSYTKLYGVRMSEAYASTLHISFDIRGGLLMRQIHHWAALLFVSAICVHLLRIFFTGAFRKPREINWLIGVIMFALALAEGFAGYSLPDDLLSGTGLRIAQGVVQAIPIVGTYLFFFMFGGEFPGQDFIPRLYIVHVLLIPGILLALITAHLLILWHQKHTQWPGAGRTERNVVGAPFYPAFVAKTGAFFFFTFGVVALLGTFAQINPIWMFGPYTPAAITAGSQPDWYIGFLEGALRMMPNWEIVFLGHNLSLNILIPGLIIPGLFFTVLFLYPAIERWATGDRSAHHVLDRPRNAAARTAFGAAGIAFYGVLWAAGANDVIAERFHIDLYATTWTFRVAIFVAPVVAYIVTKRACLGLQRRDAELVHHGIETGIIKRLPSGEYIEVTRPLPEESQAVVLSRKELPPAPTAGEGVGAPRVGRLRKTVNRLFTRDVVPVPGHEEGKAAAEEERRELTRG